MKKVILSAPLALIAAITLTGCQSMPEKQCEAIYESGGNEYTVSVFGVREQGNQLTLRAGYPFSFHYVSANNFKSHTCKKAP